MTRFVTLTAVLLPFLEIPGFVLVSYWIGVIPMLALVVLGVILGIMVLQRVGMNALVNLRLAMARGEEPGHTLIDAACFALGGFLLTIPGFISDVIALTLFLPWTRNYLLRRMARHFDVKTYGGGFANGPGNQPQPGGGVIEGEYSVVNSDEDNDSDSDAHSDSGRPRLKNGSSGS
jgi:UPF0716 protein FxsA